MSFWSRGDQLLLHVIEHLEVRIMLLKLFLSQLQSFNCCWAMLGTYPTFFAWTASLNLWSGLFVKQLFTFRSSKSASAAQFFANSDRLVSRRFAIKLLLSNFLWMVSPDPQHHQDF